MIIDWDAVGLGEKPDPDLAAELGVSTSRVCYQREKRGIPILRRPTREKWAGVDWDAVGLGTKPDRQLAEELGIPVSSVRHYREQRGIPLMRKVPRVDWDAVGLGTRPDETIAAELGVLVSYVGRQRRQRGIPSYRALLGTAPSVRGICQGFYWLGLITRRAEQLCELPHCNAPACCAPSFLVRGDVVALQTCAEHGRRIEEWACSPAMGQASAGMMASLRASGGRLPGRLRGELGLS